MKLLPLGDRLILQEVEAKENKIGGIYIPDSAKEKPQTAKVVAVGTDETVKEIFEVGDEVLYAKYSGTDVEFEGENYKIVSMDDILAKVQN